MFGVHETAQIASGLSRAGVALAAALLALTVADPLVAKTPGTTYCYVGVCHRVKTIAETAAEIGKPAHVIASYYDAPWRDRFNPRMETSSGEVFRPDEDDNVASPHYPDGTRLLVWSPINGAAAIVRVNNAGPYFSNRTLDAAYGLAAKLGFGFRGIARVEMMVVSAPRPTEAEYALARKYSAVPGTFGAFRNLAEAHAAWSKLPDAAVAATETALALQEASALPQRPAGEERVVTIPGGGSRAAALAAASLGPYAPTLAGSGKAEGAVRAAARGRGKFSRVVLKPVKLRRPQLLAALAAKARPAKSRIARAR